MSRSILLVACLLGGLPGMGGRAIAQEPLAPAGGAAAASAESAPNESGVRRIPITTPKGTFEVWTRKVGANPRVKVLVLHGGPGFAHGYLQALEGRLDAAGFEFYFYDQLGSYASDQPDEPELWQIPRFVDEVEQVRRALGLERENFYLYGQSWGGILAIEYALAHQENLAGMIISNMMASIPAYNEYATRMLIPELGEETVAEIQRLEAAGETEDPRYFELLAPHYERHVLRRPMAEWPAPVLRAFETVNKKIYVPMQGASELGASGKLQFWDRSADLGRIGVPALVMAARHDTMDPLHLKWMAEQMPRGRYHLSPEGSHLALWDDADAYFAGLIGFLRAAEAGEL